MRAIEVGFVAEEMSNLLSGEPVLLADHEQVVFDFCVAHMAGLLVHCLTLAEHGSKK
jgi:hypothetical protein